LARKLDQIIVIDVEATCWEGNPPPGMDNEIIEIGLCILDVPTLQRVSKESLMVKPEHSTVSEYCTQLTTITPEMADMGIPFQQACDRLSVHYESSNRPWASYGDYDRMQIERQCRAIGIHHPFGPTHINIKNLLALTLGLKREVGLDKGLELLNMPLEGTHHRGVDDAWNIAAILAEILRRFRIKPEGIS
jgi:inhibitor of KinA sporulation pathway (predicted exonuclease)